MNKTLKLLSAALIPVALFVACNPEKHVRIVIVPEQTADAEARQKKVKISDIVFKQNQAGKIAEHPFFFNHDKLEAHDGPNGCETQPPITISVSHREEVVWEADGKFTILDIRKSSCPDHQVETAPANPFYGTMPYPSTVAAPFLVHSGIARPQSVGQKYKIKIEINGQILDPDLICMM